MLASDPTGICDRAEFYPASLMHPDRSGVGRRSGYRGGRYRGRPWSISAGYGINHDTSMYQGIAIQMAQQAPLSTSLTAQNSPACPLTLANGFNACSELRRRRLVSIRIIVWVMCRRGT